MCVSDIYLECKSAIVMSIFPHHWAVRFPQKFEVIAFASGVLDILSPDELFIGFLYAKHQCDRIFDRLGRVLLQ